MTIIDNYAQNLQTERIRERAERKRKQPPLPPSADPFLYSPIIQAVRKYGHLTMGRRDMIPTEDHFMGLPIYEDGLCLGLNGPPNKAHDRQMIHDHTFFELAYVYHGSFFNVTSTGEQQFQQGDFILMAPKAMHATYVTKMDDYLFNFLITENQMFSIVNSPIMKNCTIQQFVYSHVFNLQNAPDSIIFHTGDDFHLRSIAESLMLLLIDKPEGYQNAAYYGAGMLFSMLDHFCEEFHSPYHMDAQANEILSYIRNHFPTLTLQTLSEHFSYSPSYLSHQIKKWTGSSFSQLIQQLRLSQAVRYLENTDMKHQAIVDKCGLCNVGNFCKLFKQAYGTTPTEYRRSYRERNSAEGGI